MKRAPILVAPAMVDDIKRIPALAKMLEAGEIEVKRLMPTANELAAGKSVRWVKGDGSIEAVEPWDFYE